MDKGIIVRIVARATRQRRKLVPLVARALRGGSATSSEPNGRTEG